MFINHQAAPFAIVSLLQVSGVGLASQASLFQSSATDAWKGLVKLPGLHEFLTHLCIWVPIFS